MSLPSRPAEREFGRHQLSFVSRPAWRALLATRSDLAGDPLVAAWADRHWPLIGRRPSPGDAPGVALGLPLPPFAGKRRLSVVMQRDDIIATAPPPELVHVSRLAPNAWWPTLDAVAAIAARHDVVVRVFGSLAWRALTGLDYVTPRSDVDLLFYVRRNCDAIHLAAELARVEAAAPMRIDGELVRDDHAAVNWREFHKGQDEVLVKTMHGVALFETKRFPRHGVTSVSAFALLPATFPAGLDNAHAASTACVELIAAAALQSLLLELETWPKPGLVSHIDAGSHTDMDAGTFRRSAAAIAPFFCAFAAAGARNAAMAELRHIGLNAEASMLRATNGVNTHRGAIFGLGLLCAAAGARSAGRAGPGWSLGTTVSRLWGSSILRGPVLLHSHGTQVRRRFGAGGAREEAARGFPGVYRLGLPALRHAMQRAPRDTEAARVEACFALIAGIEDTNLLHRGGAAGLRFAREAASNFLAQGGTGVPAWRQRAREVHTAFVTRRLSPGGAADLLALTLFVQRLEEQRHHG